MSDLNDQPLAPAITRRVGPILAVAATAALALGGLVAVSVGNDSTPSAASTTALSNGATNQPPLDSSMSTGAVTASNAAAATAGGTSEPTDEIDEGDEIDNGEAGLITPSGNANPTAPAEPNGENGSEDGGAVGGELDPTTAPSTSPTGCDATEDGAQFFTPREVLLDSDVDDALIHIENCSDGPISIQLGSGRGVQFGPTDVNVPVGGTDVYFAIDNNEFGAGAFSERIKVTEVGCCAEYVTIHGFVSSLAIPSGDLGLTAGEGQGGCKAGCITAASLTPHSRSADIDIHIETIVPADIEVYVSRAAPVVNGDANGEPHFPKTRPIATVDSASVLDTTFEGLLPATKYHTIARAEDDNGVTVLTDTFTTGGPVNGVGGLEVADLGCASGCITTATATPTDDIDHFELYVETDRPAKLIVQYGTADIDDSSGTPVLHSGRTVDYTDEFYRDWRISADDLESGATYHLVVTAIDEQGRKDVRSGSFRTAVAPSKYIEIGFERVVIKTDGDASSVNKGELRMAWGTAEQVWATRGEEKIHAGSTVDLTDANFSVVRIEPGQMTPQLYFFVGERDGRPICEGNLGQIYPTPGMQRCSRGEYAWSWASMWEMQLDEVERLERCSEYGLDDYRSNAYCRVIESSESSDDFARFDVLVWFDLADRD